MIALPNPWFDDKLGRKEESIDLRLFISTRLAERRGRGATASYVLNVNSGWGHGKTYFLKRLGQDLQHEDGAVVAMVNAWESDFSDDPLTAIMSSIDEALRPFLGKQTVKKAWRAALKSGGSLTISLAKNVAGKLVSKYAGDIASEVYDATLTSFSTADAGSDDQPGGESDKDEDEVGVGDAVREVVDKLADSALERLMKGFRAQQRSIALFKGQLGMVAESLDRDREAFPSIYVLVDELDRCRPLYAIRLLEAVKHLFETDGVVFIVATDTEQLAESVKAVYGSNFDSNKYLYRFFDRTYRLRKPDSKNYIGYLLDKYDIPIDTLAVPRGTDLREFIRQIFHDLDLSLRDIEQCFDMLQTVCTMWKESKSIEIGYLLFLIVLYHAGRMSDYAVVSGQKKGEIDGILTSNSVLVSKRTGGYQGSSRIVAGTTKDLLSAYMNCLSKSLVDFASQDLPSNPLGEFVAERMRGEFHELHHGMAASGDPPFSVIRDYARFVELAIRFETEEDAKAREAKQAAYALERG